MTDNLFMNNSIQSEKADDQQILNFQTIENVTISSSKFVQNEKFL